MSMKWKLRKDKIQAETPAPDSQAAPDAPTPESPIFDLSGAAFAPVGQPPAPASLPSETGEAYSVEDEPAADGEGMQHEDNNSATDDEPRFQVDEDVLSFLTEDAPAATPLPTEQTYAAETVHAEAGPQGIALSSETVLPSEEVTEFARLDDHAPYLPSFDDASTATASALETDGGQPAFDTDEEAPAFESDPAPAFSLDAPLSNDVPLSDSQREAIAPGLVSSEGGGLPRVAPFVLDVPASVMPIASTDAPHRLILRLGNLSATYELNKAVTTIGRPDSITQNYPDIEIELDDGVSRRHAEVRRDKDRFYIVDVGSTNGTILNGEMMAPQQPALLAHGDRIRVGERTEIVFE